jgi:hypothetical protein
MEFFKSIFYRVLPVNTIMTKSPITIVDETKNNLNLQNYKIDFDKFDKEVQAKCNQNLFYNYYNYYK